MNLRTRAIALATTAVLSGVLVGCGDDDTEPTAADPNDGTTSAAPLSETATDDPTTAPTEQPGMTTVPVYFVGDSPMGPRLYREFRQVEADNPMDEAAALLLAGDSIDPDYGTALSGVTIDSIAQEDGAIVVTLAEDSVTTADKSLGPDVAAVAVQSLVYTLQGITETRDAVRVELADGTPTDIFGQPTAEGVDAAPQLDVLSLVNVTTPESDATVSGTFTATGVASSFEATVPWQILDAEGTAVLTGFSTAEGWIDKLYPWETDVDVSSLAAGQYTFVALTDDPSGGEGPGPFVDTKTITVE